jgi:hypothetical protein
MSYIGENKMDKLEYMYKVFKAYIDVGESKDKELRYCKVDEDLSIYYTNSTEDTPFDEVVWIPKYLHGQWDVFKSSANIIVMSKH